MDDLTFKERVNKLKKAKKLTDEDLAMQVSRFGGARVAPRTIEAYKKDPRTMPYWVLHGMCKVLGCKIEYLTEGRDTEAEAENAIRWIRKAMKGEEI